MHLIGTSSMERVLDCWFNWEDTVDAHLHKAVYELAYSSNLKLLSELLQDVDNMNRVLIAYISCFLLLSVSPWNSAPLTVFPLSAATKLLSLCFLSRTVNTNSINVPLYSELCWWNLLTLFAVLLTLLFSTVHQLAASNVSFSVCCVFYCDRICLSCNKRFTHLPTYLKIMQEF